MAPIRKKDGYPDEVTKACCVPNRVTSIVTNKIEAVVFFIEAMYCYFQYFHQLKNLIFFMN
jgi:hypothetical protein